MKKQIKFLIQDNEIDCGGYEKMEELREKHYIEDMTKGEAFYFGYDLALQNLLQE